MTDFITTIIAELGSIYGMQEFVTTTDPSSSLAQNYTFKLTLNGTAFNSGNDITVTLTATESLASIATKIAAAINAITASSVTAAVDLTSGKIRVKSTSTTEGTSQVSFATPTTGNSLLTLLGGVGVSVKKPYLLNGNRITSVTTLPAITVHSALERIPLYTINNLARIKEVDFNLRIYVPQSTTVTNMQAYSDLLQSECERLVIAKSISGGWWQVENTFFEKGSFFDVPNMLCKQTLFVSTPGRA